MIGPAGGVREEPPVSRVAVVVHGKKVRGGDLSTVRDALESAGFPDPLWYELRKSKQARKRAREAVHDGADLVFAWGGDGTVQRCVDALAGRDVTLAVIPAGTSNLLASALGIPTDLGEAVQVGLHGDRRVLDTGTVNGERFAVVAGAGLDALLVRDADSELKGRIGRAAYVYTAVKNLRVDAEPVEVRVDGRRLFRGRCTSVLVGNTKGAVGGLDVFESSEPDDGVLEVGVVTAEGPLELVRTAARAVVGKAEGSPFLRTGRGSSILVRFESRVPYEVDGGDRKPARTLKVKVRPRSITVCVPGAEARGSD
jgi:diacylglycerol kinase (ATP)